VDAEVGIKLVLREVERVLEWRRMPPNWMSLLG
jgi:hypothetical protein